MAILSWPTCAFITSVEWTPPDPPTQVNRSEWTGREQVVILNTAGRWSARVQMEPKLSGDEALDLEAFRVELRGRVNSFRMPAVTKPQFTVAVPLQVNGGGQTGATLNVKNGGAGRVIKRGHKLTLNEQLFMNMTTVTLDGSGNGTLTLSNPMRSTPSNSASIEVVSPTCLVKLADSAAGWTESYPEIFDWGQLQVEETF